MTKLVAFDLDGTLTQHKSPMTPEIRSTLDALRERGYALLMVGAGSCARIARQMESYPVDILGNYGMQQAEWDGTARSHRTVRDERRPCDREDVLRRANAFRAAHGLTEFAGESVEFHDSGVVTFALLGTKAAAADKLAFDPDRRRRRALYAEVCALFPDFKVFVGGSSSFDMAPAPFDKAWALSRLCEARGLAKEDVLYVGDDYGPGGNDESVLLAGFPFLKIDDYRDTPAALRARLLGAPVASAVAAAAPAAAVVEGGIAKFPAGRLPAEARAEAEAAFARTPSDRVWRIDEGTSLDEVNALELPPGSTVLFRRGGVWRGQLRVRSGTPGHPVRYGAWGEGPAPVIQPSLDRSAPGDWRREPDGLWRAETGSAVDIGNVVPDHGDAGCLFKRGSRAELVRDRDFWFDPATGGVLVRSDAGSPAVRWRSVELARKLHAVDEACAHDVEYEGIAVRYGAAHGFGGGGARRVSILGCEVSWIGGGVLYVDDLGNNVRYGNGIELWGCAEDVRVEGCRIRQCFDAGLTHQSSEDGTLQRNILWKGNEVSECEYSYEFWVQGEGSRAENVRLEGNVFRDAGGSWGHEQRWNPGGAHLRFQDTTVPTPGFAVVGNRFSHATECLARLFNEWRGQALFRDNVWESGGEPVCVWHARPRAGLRFLCPDYLDRNHRDDRAEIESQGPGGRDFPATPEGFRAFEETFGFGPDSFRRT